MSDWVRTIYEKLTPADRSRVLVVDPDGLFSYPMLQKAFVDTGYTLYQCASALEVRRMYERELRGKNEKTLLIAAFPYVPRPDMRQAVLVARIGYRDLFPYFDAAALAGLGYNALCTLSDLRPYETLGYDGTIRFLLENLYHVDLQALDASRTKERFLSAFVDVVFHEDGFNAAIRDYLYSEGRIRLSPLGKDMLSRESLVGYFRAALEAIGEGRESPCEVFEPLLLKALGTLLTRQFLEPIKIRQDCLESLDARLLPFFFVDDQEEQSLRIESLLAQLRAVERNIQDVPGEWLDLGPTLGEAWFLALSSQDTEKSSEVRRTIDVLNVRFQDFLDRCYWQMFSLSGTRRPLVVSRVLEYMRAQPERKKALIVIDGMNTWQWHQISSALGTEGIVPKTGAVFSYLPSITAWSRQALFRGAKPNLCRGTEVERQVFGEYWSGRGYTGGQIVYTRFSSALPFDITTFPHAEVIGAVCTDLDDLMHGALMGNAQLSGDTDTWIGKSGIVAMIRDLRDAGYRCYITSDHGNIEARGRGSLSMGARCLSTSRSKRHIEFTSEAMAKAYLTSHPELQAGLRDTTVFLRDDSAFTSDPLVVTHGGSHILEMITPFGIVERL